MPHKSYSPVLRTTPFWRALTPHRRIDGCSAGFPNAAERCQGGGRWSEGNYAVMNATDLSLRDSLLPMLALLLLLLPGCRAAVQEKRPQPDPVAGPPRSVARASASEQLSLERSERRVVQEDSGEDSGEGSGAAAPGSAAPGASPPPLLRPQKLQEGWVEAEGEALAANITPEQAWSLALLQARGRIIETSCGIEVQVSSSSLKREEDRVYLEAFTRASAQRTWGVVVEEQPPQQSLLPLNVPGMAPRSLHRVRLRARVRCDRSLPDPSFQVSAQLDRDTYRGMQEARITLRSSLDGYVSIFCWGADDRIYQLLPNPARPDHQIRAGASLTFPDPARPTDPELRVACPEGQSRCLEAFWVLVTREPLQVSHGWLEVSQPGRIPTATASFAELGRLLIQLPRDQWTLEQLPYEVRMP